MKSTFACLTALLAGAAVVGAAPLRKRADAVNWDSADQTDIRYTNGQWTFLTDQGTTNFDGTLSYANDDSAYEFTLPDDASSFALFTPLKYDRGAFNVFRVSPDGHKISIGSGDQYGSDSDGSQPSTQVFSYSIPANTIPSFRVENVPDDSRISGGAYLSLDYLSFFQNPDSCSS